MVIEVATITIDGVMNAGIAGDAGTGRRMKAKCECREGNAQYCDQQGDKDDAPITYFVTHSYSCTPNKIVSWHNASGFRHREHRLPSILFNGMWRGFSGVRCGEKYIPLCSTTSLALRRGCVIRY